MLRYQQKKYFILFKLYTMAYFSIKIAVNNKIAGKNLYEFEYLIL